MECRGNSKSFNVNSFNNVNNFVCGTVIDDKPQVLQWLSPLEPGKRHQHLMGSRLEGVGQWIFRTVEFQRWSTGEDGSAPSVLFCHGDPGVGKTHLSSLVMDHVYGGGPDITVAGLYCDYLDRKEQTASNMLGSILRQLVGSRSIPGDIRKAFEDAKEHIGGVGPRVPELLKMLRTTIARRQRVVICIDGLDESVPAHRTRLLSSLQATINELPNVRLFLTGRPFIRSEVENYFPGMNTISVSPTKEDTEAFLRMKLDGDTEPDAMDERLRGDIMEIIPKTISELFLLVSLSIEAILAETTIHRRKEKLKQMSTGQDVGRVYFATLERIRAQKRGRSRLGMEAIMWVAHSERPLKPDELCQALGVELGSKDLSSDNDPSIRTILNCGLGLVTVDSSSSTVRLVHFTLQEYILANPILFHSPHSAIAEVCLTYLNFDCIRELPTSLSKPPQTAPFLGYASCYWGAHARRETSERVTSLALKLLDRFDTHISCKLLLLTEYPWNRPFDGKYGPVGFTGLHGVAFLGVLDIMVSLFGTKKWDLNATDVHGNTALTWATRKGHGEVVQMLLERDEVNPDTADARGRTPLSWAAGSGREEITEMLLERNDVNPDAADKKGRTPFSWAAGRGHERTAQMLLERNDVDPEAADEDGRTPFLWATKYGSQGIVKMLYERNNVMPNTAVEEGRVRLSLATSYSRGGTPEKLSEWNDVNPDAIDEDARIPSLYAAANKREKIAESLPTRNDVHPDVADKKDRTPFSWATGCGHGRTAQMPSEPDNVNPGAADKKGRRPFSWATGRGHSGIAEMRLERNDVDPGVADKSGRRPFSWATEKGHEEIVGVVVEREDIDSNSVDKSSRTPFACFLASGACQNYTLRRRTA